MPLNAQQETSLTKYNTFLELLALRVSCTYTYIGQPVV